MGALEACCAGRLFEILLTGWGAMAVWMGVLGLLLLLTGLVVLWSGMTPDQRRFRTMGGSSRRTRVPGAVLIISGALISFAALLVR